MSNSSIPGAYKTLLPYLYRYRLQYAAGLIILLLIDATQIIIPQIMRRIVDLISLGDYQLRDVVPLVCALIGSTALISIGRFGWRYFLNGSSRRIETEIRDSIFAHLVTLSYDFYQENKIGDLMARATNDLGAVRNAIGRGIVTVVDGTVMATSIIIIIFMHDAYTAGFSIIPLPFITLLILFFGRAIGTRFRLVHETYSDMSDTVQETFAGIRVVKSFVKEWWFIKKFTSDNDNYRKANMSAVMLYGFFFPLVILLSGVTSLILFTVGGRRVIEGFLTPGELTALFSYLQMLIWPLMGMGMMVNTIQRGAISLGRINELLDTQPSIRSPEYPRKTAAGNASLEEPPLIEIRNLSFSYTPDIPVLTDISLTIPAGSIFGILGRTGAGKSTFIKTLPRMIDPPPGTVFLKGIPVEEWDLAQLRGLFAVAPQDSYLFSDSIKNNMGYSLESPQEAAMLDSQADQDRLLLLAAALSAIDQDFRTFAQGWETVIGERGLTLSGGQKQRVAISRAIVKSAEILILDDSFSAVDAETEKKILDRILEERQRLLREGKKITLLIISHKISTLRHADTVMVLDGGTVSEYGSPGELLLLPRGFYSQMAALQQLEMVHG